MADPDPAPDQDQDQDQQFSIHPSLEDYPPDFHIELGDWKWKIHSEVLQKNSMVFEGLLAAGMKEARDKTVELKEDDHFMIGRLLQWLYTGNFCTHGAHHKCESLNGCIHEMMEVGRINNTTDPDPVFELSQENEDYQDWQVFIDMYKLADKYIIEALKTEMIKMLGATMESNVEMLHYILASFDWDLACLERDKELCVALLTPIARLHHNSFDRFQSCRDYFNESSFVMNVMLDLLVAENLRVSQGIDKVYKRIDLWRGQGSPPHVTRIPSKTEMMILEEIEDDLQHIKARPTYPSDTA